MKLPSDTTDLKSLVIEESLSPSLTTPSRVFRAPNGVYYTKQLFFETADTDRSIVLYTLKDSDHSYDGKVYPSLRRLYLDLDDESEYIFANQYFDGWPHYRKLLQCSWFLDYVTAWREELKIRSMAMALNNIKSKARSGDISTSKYLLERGWDKDSVGRPTKEKIRQKAQEIFRSSGDIQDDFKRISEGFSFN